MYCIETSRKGYVLIFYISIFLFIQATRTTATTKIIRDPYRINEITKYNRPNLIDTSGSQQSNRITRNIDKNPSMGGDHLQLLLDLYQGLPRKPLPEQSDCIDEIEFVGPYKSHDGTEFNNMNEMEEQPNNKNFYDKNDIDSNHKFEMEGQSQTSPLETLGTVSQSTNEIPYNKDEFIRNCRDQESNAKQEVQGSWSAFRSKIKKLTQRKSSSPKANVDTTNDALNAIKKKFEEKNRSKESLIAATGKSHVNKEPQDQSGLASYKGAVTDLATDSQNSILLTKDKTIKLFKPVPKPKEISVEDIENIFRKLERYDTSAIGRQDTQDDSKNDVLPKEISSEDISNILSDASKEQEKARSKGTGEEGYSPAAKQEPTVGNTLPKVNDVKELTKQNTNDFIQLKPPKVDNIKLSEHLAAALPRLQRQMENLESPAVSIDSDEESNELLAEPKCKNDIEFLTKSLEESEHPALVRHILQTKNKKQCFDNAMVEDALDGENSRDCIDSGSRSQIVDFSNDDDVDLATRAGKLFKRVTDEINGSRNNVHVGELYDEYKKRLDAILTQQKNTIEPGVSSNSESKNGPRTIVEKKSGEKNKKKAKIAKETNHQITDSTVKAADLDKNVQRLANAIFKIPYIVHNQKLQAASNKSPTIARKTKGANDITDTGLPPIPILKSSSSSAFDIAEHNSAHLNAPCIQNAIKALETRPYISLYDEYKTQLNVLNNILMTKEGFSGKIPTPLSSLSVKSANAELCVNPSLSSGDKRPKRKKIKRQSSVFQHRYEFVPTPNYLQGFANALENVLNEPKFGGGNMLLNAASKINMSVMELAERLTQSDNARKYDEKISEKLRKYMDYPVNVPTNYPNSHLYNNNLPAKRRESGYLSFNIPVPAPVIRYTYGPNTPPLNVDSILDQLIKRLDFITNNKTTTKLNTTPPSMATSNTSLDQNCVCVNPMEGTPCDIIGSWESSFLGILLDIKRDKHFREKRKYDKKINAEKTDSLLHLNIDLRELVPPREHAFMEMLNEWCIGANALNTYGGPLLMVARKAETTVVGSFIGYCRTCGGVDTIFGSWTMYTPSKDCQDITTSIFEKRDLLRRYSMDARRRERFNTLYNKNNFVKN